MTQDSRRSARTDRSSLPATPLALVLLAALGLTTPALSQAVRVAPPAMPLVVQAEAETANPETVRLLVGLGLMRADLQLGMLALGEGSAAAHFSRPRAEVWPGLQDGMLAAGVPDLEPVLQKLEAGGSKDAVREAYIAAEAALLRARSTLNPSGGDTVMSLVQLAKHAAGEINPSGPTGVSDYQRAWALLMVARGELDLLSRHADPAMAGLAAKEAMAIDEMIIAMPDPHQAAPVAYDLAPLQDLIARLEKLEESV